MFDNDKAGHDASKALSQILAPLAKSIEIIRLKKIDDPGKLSFHQAQKIKYQLGFNM
jgi:DNA primase